MPVDNPAVLDPVRPWSPRGIGLTRRRGAVNALLERDAVATTSPSLRPRFRVSNTGSNGSADQASGPCGEVRRGGVEKGKDGSGPKGDSRLG